MSSEDEDDYLSNKFLEAASSSKKPSTYSQIRKEAQKKAHLKNEQNKTKSQRQLELEAREEGLSKSLFERAKEDEAAGVAGSGNKALSIMMKMGFKPGQSLGNTGHQADAHGKVPRPPTVGHIPAGGDETPPVGESSRTGPHTIHKTEPLPLQEWAGRKGIGLGKRARSPSAAERLAKMAKMAVDMGQRDFRSRARDDYNNRRAEGRLVPAQSTCRTLDEQMGKLFNVLWLNPSNHDTFPVGLIEALALHSTVAVVPEDQGDSIQARLRKQMQADALHPISSGDDDEFQEGLSTETLATQIRSSTVPVPPEDQFSHELLEEATQFLRLQAQDRLHLLLTYLREKHAYCFWCGVEYESSEEMHQQCPGSEEDDHD